MKPKKEGMEFHTSCKKLILAKDFAALEETFTTILTQFEKGEINEFEADRAFGVFNNYVPAFEPILLEWTQVSPNSYIAHLALGIFEIGKADRRLKDSRLAGNDPDIRESAYGAESLGHKTLTRATTLNHKPFFAFISLMRFGQVNSGELEQNYQKALELYPKSLLARMTRIDAIGPHKTGSLDPIQLYAEGMEHLILPNSERKYLRSALQNAKATWKLERQGDKPNALLEFQRAVDIVRTKENLRDLATLTAEIDSRLYAFQLFDEAYRIDPTDMQTAALAGKHFLSSARPSRRRFGERLLVESASWNNPIALAALEDLKHKKRAPVHWTNIVGDTVIEYSQPVVEFLKRDFMGFPYWAIPLIAYFIFALILMGIFMSSLRF